MNEPRHFRIVRLLDTLAPPDGIAPSALASVRLMRAHAPQVDLPMQASSIVIACQGGARAQAEPSHPPSCFVLPAPFPFRAPDWTSHIHPMLGVAVTIDAQQAAELVLAMGGAPRHAPAAHVPASARLDAVTGDAVLRLLKVVDHPADAAILGAGIVRELLYRVLAGPLGPAIHAILRRQRHAGRIGKALRRMHDGYDGPLDVATLARDAGMSITAFHNHFKAVTHTTPIQYLKALRLHRARLLMTQEGLGAAAAARLVGYESSSQFSREFKRFFGRTPAHEAATVLAALAGTAQPHPPRRAPDYHPSRNSEGNESRFITG